MLASIYNLFFTTANLYIFKCVVLLKANNQTQVMLCRFKEQDKFSHQSLMHDETRHRHPWVPMMNLLGY